MPGPGRLPDCKRAVTRADQSGHTTPNTRSSHASPTHPHRRPTAHRRPPPSRRPQPPRAFGHYRRPPRRRAAHAHSPAPPAPRSNAPGSHGKAGQVEGGERRMPAAVGGWRADRPRPVRLMQAGNAVNLFGNGSILPFENHLPASTFHRRIDSMTEQEQKIALLAAAGMTNKEIGTQSRRAGHDVPCRAKTTTYQTSPSRWLWPESRRAMRSCAASRMSASGWCAYSASCPCMS
jgi:hypothetical protein